MRAIFVFVMTAWTACTPAGQPGPASAGTADGTTLSDTAPPAATPAGEATAAAAEPSAAASPTVESVELTRGKRIATHGVRIMLRGTGTEHRPDAHTVSRAEIEVSNGDEERTISLEREQPGDAKFVEVFDLGLALESVDASRKPSTAQILVRR